MAVEIRPPSPPRGWRGLLAACVFGLLLACGGGAEQQYESLEGVPWDDFGAFRGLWLEDELAQHPELLDASRYHLRLEIADDLGGAAGHLRVRFTNPGPLALEGLPFVCFPNLTSGSLTVSAVAVEGVPVEPELRQDRSLLLVPVPGGLPAGERTEISLDYELRVPREASGGVLGFRDGVLSLAYGYPMIPAPEAWDHPLPPRFGDFVTNEASFYVVEASAPAEVVLAFPGIELGRRTVQGRTEVLFALGPARDLFLAASREFVVLEERRGGVSVRSVAPRGREEGARLVLSAAGEALESFSRRFGPYPFSTFSVVAAPFNALGMEFSGITLLALRLYDLRASANGIPHQVLLEATLAHELAHQWFYASVGNDQLEEPWIDESLAQYASWLYYRDRKNAAGARGMVQEFEGRWDRVQRAPIPIGRPVSAYTPLEYSAIIYGRAPLFLQALALEMGQERFDRFLAELAARFEWRLIDGEDFRLLAEETCGCDLAALWGQWVD